MTVVLGFMAFAIDLSQMAAYRSELQRAVDAGAHAGAVQLTKARYDSAAAIASSFTVANVVFGKPPIIDAVEYGTWNSATATFTPICAGLGCASATVKGADAIRISGHGAGSTIFAGILGALGFSIQVKAVGWVAKTVTSTQCLKPIALPYSTLTKALDKVLGILPSDPAGDTLRVLTDVDLGVIRDSASALTVCLKLGLPGTPCTGAEAGLQLPGNFQTLRLSLGISSLLDDLSSGCFGAAPGDVLSLSLNLLGNISILTDLLLGRDAWCANFGGSPCVMKVALWQNIDLLNGTVTIKTIGSLVIDGPPNLLTGNISAHFSNAIDDGPIGIENGMLDRPVLVQ
ncbi:MAG: pilus assembly protein TadG-related protein [Gemmatimonadota bacterium]|nr:pilus assembly protein TadG-related protein [Gemmatimonadota bacterium]